LDPNIMSRTLPSQIKVSSAQERVLHRVDAVRLGAETQQPRMAAAAGGPQLQPADATDQPDRGAGYRRSVQAWARQVATVSRYAEAAESRVRELEAQLGLEEARRAAIGRRFGQQSHESFETFVVRLAMTARAKPAGQSHAEAPLLNDVVDPTWTRTRRQA
jgi:hypothetical protein